MNGLPQAIRDAAAREKLGVEQFRRKHRLANAFYYGLLRGEAPIPERNAAALRKLRKAGVEHELLKLV